MKRVLKMGREEYELLFFGLIQHFLGCEGLRTTFPKLCLSVIKYLSWDSSPFQMPPLILSQGRLAKRLYLPCHLSSRFLFQKVAAC